MLKLVVDDIRKLVLQFFKLFGEESDRLIDFFLCVVLLVQKLRVFLRELLFHIVIQKCRTLFLLIATTVKDLSILLVLREGRLDMSDEGIMANQLILLVLELLGNLLLVLSELLIICCKMLINSLELILHSGLDVFAPFLLLDHFFL